MSSSRLSGLNIFLLVVTVLSLMFGTYGFVTGGMGEQHPAANAVGTARLDEDLEDRGGAVPLSDVESPSKAGGPAQAETADKTENQDARGPSPKPVAELPGVEATSGPSDSGNAVIQGVVLDQAGSPVPGATVTARRSDLDVKPPQFQAGEIERYRREVSEFLDKTASETRTATSDKAGAFAFKGLDEKLAYDLSADCKDVGAGDASRVAAGDKVVILLSAEIGLHGRVETSDGKPVKQFTIRYWRQNRRWQAKSRDFEDEQGKFSLSAKRGTLQLEVSASGFSQDKPLDVQVGSDDKEQVIVLATAAIMSGTVTDNDGKPLAGVQVRIGAAQNNRNWGWQQQNNNQSASTDSKGRYRFDTLPPKETTFTASLGEMSATKTITLVQGNNTLDFQMDVGAVLSIHLVDPDGKPVEADTIWFQGKGNRGWPRPERMPDKEPGLAEYAGLKPGEYTMTVSGGGFPTVKQEIKVEAGKNDINVKFSKGAMLTGSVVSSSGSKIANIGVRLRKDKEGPWGGWGTGRIAQVDEDGNFKLGPAEPGQWTLEVYTNSNWNSSVYSNTISLSEGENTQNITVDAGATVIVKVVDEEGNPVSWGRVQLQGEKNYNQNTNGDGTATISFVEVGSYNLIASSRGLASPTQFISLRAGDNPLTVQLQKPNCSRITHVYPGTQAAKAGMKVGDLVIEYNGTETTSWRGLSKAIGATKQTDEVTVLVERGGSMLTFTLKGGYVGIEGVDGVR
jgi:protocatechuate 3,4-dioxygenase beta subunit/LEA14-like dessication related protein